MLFVYNAVFGKIQFCRTYPATGNDINKVSNLFY